MQKFEQGTKLRATKGGHEQKLSFEVVHGSSLYRFIWFCSMPNNGYWFGGPFPFIPTVAIGALHSQQSAVHCLSSKCGRTSLRTAWFWYRCAASASAGSVHLFGSLKKLSYDSFQGQAGPRQENISRLDAKLKCATPGMDWVSGCPGPLLALFGYLYVIDLGIDNFIW